MRCQGEVYKLEGGIISRHSNSEQRIITSAIRRAPILRWRRSTCCKLNIAIASGVPMSHLAPSLRVGGIWAKRSGECNAC